MVHALTPLLPKTHMLVGAFLTELRVFRVRHEANASMVKRYVPFAPHPSPPGHSSRKTTSRPDNHSDACTF